MQGISAYKSVRFDGICGGVEYCCRVFKILKAFRRAWDFVKAQVTLVFCRRKLEWLAPRRVMGISAHQLVQFGAICGGVVFCRRI